MSQNGEGLNRRQPHAANDPGSQGGISFIFNIPIVQQLWRRLRPKLGSWQQQNDLFAFTRRYGWVNCVKQLLKRIGPSAEGMGYGYLGFFSFLPGRLLLRTFSPK